MLKEADNMEIYEITQTMCAVSGLVCLMLGIYSLKRYVKTLL